MYDSLFSVCRILYYKMALDMDYKILNLYKTRQYDKCLKLCDVALQSKSDRMLEYVRMRTMTVQAKIAGNGYEEVNYCPPQDDLSSTNVAKTPRPGTSFQRVVKTAQGDTNLQAGNALNSRGMVTTSHPRTARTALYTASRASRAATAIAGGTTFTLDAPVTLRFLNKDDQFFLSAAKTLFEYIYYCEGNVRKLTLYEKGKQDCCNITLGGDGKAPELEFCLNKQAMEVAFQAQKSDDTSDWWWKFSLARCYETLGMYRNVEECLRMALKQNKHVSIYLRLVAMYVGLQQPLSALEVCRQGLAVFLEYTPLLLEQARIHERMGNIAVAVKYYRIVATEDPTNMEAIANIAMYNFYNDQPEIALRYYRRLLATSPAGPEIYNNLGLCCLYCNQWDLIIPCFRQALYYSTGPEAQSSIWFNIAHVALSTGDLTLARRCLLASLAIHEHGSARRALQALDRRLNMLKSQTT